MSDQMAGDINHWISHYASDAKAKIVGDSHLDDRWTQCVPPTP
jgi:hypothetical protein